MDSLQNNSLIVDSIDQHKKAVHICQDFVNPYVEEVQINIEQVTEANSTGYETTHEVAMSNDQTAYVEEYLGEPEEDEEFSVGDRIVDVITGNRGIVTGYRDGRVVFDNKDFGSCSRPPIMLQKI